MSTGPACRLGGGGGEMAKADQFWFLRSMRSERMNLFPKKKFEIIRNFALLAYFNFKSFILVEIFQNFQDVALFSLPLLQNNNTK